MVGWRKEKNDGTYIFNSTDYLLCFRLYCVVDCFQRFRFSGSGVVLPFAGKRENDPHRLRCLLSQRSTKYVGYVRKDIPLEHRDYKGYIKELKEQSKDESKLDYAIVNDIRNMYNQLRRIIELAIQM